MTSSLGSCNIAVMLYITDFPQELNFRTVLKMTRIQSLGFLWIILKIGFVFSGDVHFLKRFEGESVVLPCVVEQRNQSPFGVYLKRSWLRSNDVLYMHTKTVFSAFNTDDKNRTSVSGDPSQHSLNVTISQLRVSDTDRYYCEFLIDNPSSEDERIQGKMEFFLLVNANTPGSTDIELVETCTGGSAVLPCLPPQGERSAVEGVILKRQKGQAPVEIVYQLKHHNSRSPSSSSSHFSVERVQLSLVPSAGGITYNITLQQLQPEDSALYSCQLLTPDRPDSFSLGRRVFFISVQGDQCGCSSYSMLLYALFSAVAVLILLVLIGLIVIYKDKAHPSVKSQRQAPIYEEMVGVKSPRRKVASNHLEEIETSEYRNCQVKRTCLENHYEIPSGALSPRVE